MSIFNSKANYYPGTALSAPAGAYKLPGNKYYSVEGIAPRLQTNHTIGTEDTKHSQSDRIDPINSLFKLKQETSLTHYYYHNEPVETVRGKYVFVPTYVPRSDPAVIENQGLTQLKKMADDPSQYRLNEITQLPHFDYNVVPQPDLNDDIYRIYRAQMPYDMVVLNENNNGKFVTSRVPGESTTSSTTLTRP